MKKTVKSIRKGCYIINVVLQLPVLLVEELIRLLWSSKSEKSIVPADRPARFGLVFSTGTGTGQKKTWPVTTMEGSMTYQKN
jgi:hypothetical protein